MKGTRIAIRAHDDLIFELGNIAREEGLIRSQLIDRVLIDAVNGWHGFQVLDAIGRYAVDPEQLQYRDPSTLRPPPPPTLTPARAPQLFGRTAPRRPPKGPK